MLVLPLVEIELYLTVLVFHFLRKSPQKKLLQTAKKMEIDAKGLVAEAARMKKEAQKMFPSVNMKSAKPAPVAEDLPAAKTRSRKKAAADAVQ
jgi:hypothetical protein